MAIPILVTGGAGYIGSHACKALASAGFLPITYDNLSTGHAYAVKWGPFVQGDLFDQARLLETLETFQPKAVLHFAASALVIESMQHPEMYYRNNVAGTLSLLEAMRKKGLSQLVFSSTCATYGNPIHLPMTEDHPQAPINPYGRSKWMIEQILSDFSKAYGLKTAILRYFNAAGADAETEIGENHTPETHLIPSIIQAALGQRPEVVVYGTQFPTRDGSAIRDYIHVADLADAHVLALKYLFTEQDSITLNLGTGNGYSVLELIQQIQSISGKELSVHFEVSRSGEPHTLMANGTKAKEILGWSSPRSSLSLLIDSAWKWHTLLLEKTPIVRSTIQRMDEKLHS